MIPSKIRPYFITSRQKADGDSALVEGMLSCCDSDEFQVRIAGEVKGGMPAKAYLSAQNDRIALEACCRKCGKVIAVFDSTQDGYDNCGSKHCEPLITKPFVCKKCSYYFPIKKVAIFLEICYNKRKTRGEKTWQNHMNSVPNK